MVASTESRSAMEFGPRGKRVGGRTFASPDGYRAPLGFQQLPLADFAVKFSSAPQKIGASR
jgi:hypothetical protein